MSKAQDIEAGDGTTTTVIMCGSFLHACLGLIKKGIHPNKISEGFAKALNKSAEILENMSLPLGLAGKEGVADSNPSMFTEKEKQFLKKNAETSLASKIISQHASKMSDMAVEAVLKVCTETNNNNVDLNNIKIVKKLGGVIEDSELIDGMVFTQHAKKKAGGPTTIHNAKIGLIQFCLSPPKTDMESGIVVSDYVAIDRLLREERTYILDLCKQIKKTGCNCLLIQKSILRDSVTDLSLDFMAKLGIMVVTDVERDDVPFIAKTLGCRPISSIENFKVEKLGTADLVTEVDTGSGKVIRVTGIKTAEKTGTITAFFRASNQLLLDEVDRSFHDALCVVRSLVKKRKMVAGGGAPEAELMVRLQQYAKTLEGTDQYCVQAYADALEIIPTTLAENAGLKPIDIMTELRAEHAKGNKHAGINVDFGAVSDMVDAEVLQPLLVTQNALTLATETTRLILKIDDIVLTQ